MTKRIKIEFKSSVEIMNTPMKKRHFIVDGMIYPGLYVLSGDPKIRISRSSASEADRVTPLFSIRFSIYPRSRRT